MIKTFLPNRVKRGIAALFAGAFLLAGCSMLDDVFPSEDDDVILTRATQATFDTSAYATTGKDYMKMAVGETQGITVLLTPYNASTAPTWTSSNDSIVKVEAGTLTCSSSQEYAQATATLTAIDTGIATITATVDGVTTSVTVKVGGTLPAAAEWSMTTAPSATYNGVVSTLDTTGITPSDNTTPVYISSDSKSQTTLQFYSSLANSKGGISYKNNALYTGKNGSASVDTMAIRAAQYLVLNVASDNSTVSITAKPEAAALYRGMWFDDHQHTSSNDCTFDTWTNTSSTMSVYNTAEETTVTKTVNKGTYYIYINSVYISNITVSTEEKLITLTPSATAALIGADNAITLTVNPASAKVAITDGEDYATLKNNGNGSWTLTGKEAGEVEVTATAVGYASSTNVFTFSLPTASATLASDTIFISGNSNSTTLTVLPVGATVTADSTTYATFAKTSSSSAGDVYTVTGVSNCGITEAKTVTFTVTANKYNETTKSLSVKPLSITLTPSAETVNVGSAITITSDVENAVLTVNDTSVATIEKDSSGNWILTGVKKGSVTITASCAGYFNQTLDITVGEIVILAQWSLTSAPSVTYNGTTSTLDSTGIKPDTTVGSVAIASDSESETTLEFCGDINNSKKGSIAYKNNALYTGKNGNVASDTAAMRSCQYLVLNVTTDNSTVSITAKPDAAALYRGMWFDDHQHTRTADCTFDNWSDTASTMSVYNTAEEKTVTKTVSAGTYYIYINSVSIKDITVTASE